MKRSLISIAIAVCCMSLAANAVADDRRHHRGDRGHHHSQRYDRHDGRHDAKHDRHHRRDDSRGWRGGPGPGWHGGPPPHARHHAGPPRGARWARGARLPPQYRHHRYVVHDWHARDFHRPPRGYHWVNVGADYLLVGIATGVIMQAILR